MGIQFASKFPILELNEQMVLREQHNKDTDAFFRWYNNPHVAHYILAESPQRRSEAEAEIHYCRNLFYFKRGIYWSIAQKTTNEMIGAIGLSIQTTHRRAELHYDLSEAFWNQGIMTKAIECCVNYALHTMKLLRIEAITLPNNQASQRVLLKNRFVFEGTLRAYKYFQNQTYDVGIFSILPEDLTG